MSETGASATEDYGSGRYEIAIKGRLDERWSSWLEGMTFIHESNGTTSMCGPLTDQAAFHGVLNRLRNLGVPVISVQRVGPIEKDWETGSHDRS